MAAQPAALKLNTVSHEPKAKTRISENELRFSHAWYWILAEHYFRACRFSSTAGLWSSQSTASRSLEDLLCGTFLLPGQMRAAKKLCLLILRNRDPVV